MAVAVAGVGGKPLRLKDLLELDCDSCSAAGFRCYPRHLCVPAAAPLRARHSALHEEAEASRGLGRSSSLRHPLLSIRSLSRRLRNGFSWRRRDEEEEGAAAPVPAVSSSSSSSDSESSESGSSTERKSESDFSASSTESLHAGVTTAGTACTREEDKEAMERGSKEADDKEQLSPVAVMDFPFDDDDDEDDPVEEEEEGTACSTSFSDSLAQLHQRRNIQMHYKIRRRFGSVGEVGAVDLDESFAASDHDGPGSVPVQQPEYFCSDSGAATTPSLADGHRSVDACQDLPRRHNLLPLLTDAVSAVGVSERLLLDFFAETRRNGTSKSFEAAARLAEGWIQGTGARWGLKEVLCGREHLVAEMDRSQQRWSARLGEVEEEREIGVVVAGLLVDQLVGDLLTDLLT